MVYECESTYFVAYKYAEIPLFTEEGTTLYVFSPQLTCQILNTVADIVRILFMVPIYSVVSFASYLFWVSCPSRIYMYISSEPA